MHMLDLSHALDQKRGERMRLVSDNMRNPEIRQLQPDRSRNRQPDITGRKSFPFPPDLRIDKDFDVQAFNNIDDVDFQMRQSRHNDFYIRILFRKRLDRFHKNRRKRFQLAGTAAEKHADTQSIFGNIPYPAKRHRIDSRFIDLDQRMSDKRRPQANVSEVMNIIGEVEGRTCVLVDDIVDTAGTLCKAADALKAQGAGKVVAYCTHPVLSGRALENLNSSTLDELVVTDTIPLSAEMRNCTKIRQLSMANLLAEAMRRVSNEESISAMFSS